MVKQAILDINQGIYLVKLDAVARKQLVNQNLDAYQLWTLLIDLSHRMNVSVIGYCVTEKSLLLLYQSEASPEPFIQNLITQYSSWHSRTHQKRGSLFKADYQLVLIEPGKNLLDALHLVHTFPVITELTSKAEHYHLSSYHEYAQNLSHTWLKTNVVTPLIGRHDTMFSRRFKEFVAQAAHYDLEDLLSGNQPEHLAYCSEHYLTSLYEQPTALPNGISFEDVVGFACKLYQFKPIQLKTQRRHRLMPELKGMIAFLCKEYEIADTDLVMSELHMDDFDYERGLKLIDQLSDTEMYQRRQSFEHLLFQLNGTADLALIANDHDSLSEQSANIHILKATQNNHGSSAHSDNALNREDQTTSSASDDDSSSKVV